MNNQTDISAHKVFAKDNIIRGKQGYRDGPLNNFGENERRVNAKLFSGNGIDFRENGGEKIPMKDKPSMPMLSV